MATDCWLFRPEQDFWQARTIIRARSLENNPVDLVAHDGGPEGATLFRTFGAPNYSAYLIHALTGVATDFRPFGPQSTTLILTSVPFVRISGTYIAWPNTGSAWKAPGLSARIS